MEPDIISREGKTNSHYDIAPRLKSKALFPSPQQTKGFVQEAPRSSCGVWCVYLVDRKICLLFSM